MKDLLITNALIVNEGVSFKGNIYIKDGKIDKIIKDGDDVFTNCNNIIDAKGKYLLPGVIDDQVHFREPGLTHKADIYTESKAAVAGGITSFMEMPNTKPQTTTIDALNDKFKIASEKSLANYSFYMGATNDNLDEILKADPKQICGVKVFMGSSTGNMLVDKEEALNKLFSEVKLLIATHCEDEQTIKDNTELYKEKYGDDVPMKCHPEIRSAEACYLSSSVAVKLAKKHNTRLHILHLTTAKEMELFRNDIPAKEKRITNEVCVHHLWFDDSDYEKYGARIKWNPAVKTKADKEALIKAVLNDTIDIIATDHAPHTAEEKDGTYFKAMSGGPLVQHCLVTMLELCKNGVISIEKIVEKMCHTPADIFNVSKRGYIREGYWADLVLVDTNSKWKVNKENILYKCGWSPFEGTEFSSKVTHTIVNGNLIYNNGTFDESIKGQPLTFER